MVALRLTAVPYWAFTRYDRRTDQSDRPVGPTIVPCKRPVNRAVASGVVLCEVNVGCTRYDVCER